MKYLSIRNKLMLTILLSLLLLGIALLIIINTVVRENLFTELQKKGVFMSRHFSEMITQPILTEDILRLKMIVNDYIESDGDIRYIYIEDESGNILAHSFNNGFPLDLQGSNPLKPGLQYDTKRLRTDRGRMLDIAYPILKGMAGTAHIGIDEKIIDERIKGIIGIMINITLVFLVLGGIVSVIFAMKITKPLDKLVKASRSIGKGDLDQRVDITSGDEIGELADTFNVMSQNLLEKDQKLKDEMEERNRAEEYVRNILETVEEGFVVIDRDYKIVSVNRAYCEQVKMPEEDIVGKYCYEVSHALDRPCFEKGEDCAVRRTFETGESRGAIHIHRDSAGDSIYVELRSYPVRSSKGEITGAIETLSDITEKMKLEEQLRQAQKMEAVGQLAGGVAHDFNNILTAIIGYGDMLRARVRNNDQIRLYADNIMRSAERAASLTRSLLAYSRKQVLQRKVLDINDVIQNVGRLLDRIFGENIELRTVISEEKLTVLADSNQIEQVLLNLATNARDAMPEGGVFLIESSRAVIDNEFMQAHGYGEPGNYAHILVSDTGKGMGEEERERIFEPFFTTKEVGKGTGLGLSMAYGIVKQHDGFINVYSEKGTGTTFKIYLPLSESVVKHKKSGEHGMPEGGTETILVGEDDDTIRELMKTVLEESGYSVLVAVDGDDVLMKFKENKGKIDLLLLDVMMPHKSGKEAYDAIKLEAPGIKVLFISGYTEDFIKNKGLIEEGVNFLYKPISPNDLLKKLRDILEGTESSG